MSVHYVSVVGTEYDPDPSEPIMESLFQQYERTIVESLITSFGLDFIVRDQHGGDVDTIHNVRQVGTDEQMHYKNISNKENFDSRGSYDSNVYHRNERYIAKNRDVSNKKKAGELIDSYTLDSILVNGKVDLDHTIAAKEIHNDPGRVLSGLSGVDLANSDKNLHPTNPRTNRSKKADSMESFLERRGDEYTDEQKANMLKKDSIARKNYESNLATYYASPAFAKDISFSACNVGARMGLRQALGFVFTEIWFSVKHEFEILKQKDSFDFKQTLHALGEGIKKGWESAKIKYKELFSKFINGAVAGAISSVTTTLCNVFFTTSKNVVRLIRQAWVSLVEAAKVLFLNPDGYPFGERMKAMAKILSTGASVIVGISVSEALAKTGIGAIPVVGEIVQVFCGTLVTGIMSCTLLYLFDRHPLVNKLVKFLNTLPSIDSTIASFKEQVAYLEKYAAKLMEIDINVFQKETSLYINLTKDLSIAETPEELNDLLYKASEAMGISISWKNHGSFDSFMQDKNTVLVFG